MIPLYLLSLTGLCAVLALTTHAEGNPSFCTYQKRGGLHFIKVGPYGFSFYKARNKS